MSNCCSTKQVRLPSNSQLVVSQGDCGEEICLPTNVEATFEIGSVVQRKVCLNVDGTEIEAWAILEMTAIGSRLLRYENSQGQEISGAVADCSCSCDTIYRACTTFWGFDYLGEGAWDSNGQMTFDLLVDGTQADQVVINYLDQTDGAGKASWYGPLVTAINNLPDWEMSLITDVDNNNEGDRPIWQLSYKGADTQELQIHKYENAGAYNWRDRYIFTANENGTMTIQTDDGMTGNEFGTAIFRGECQPVVPVSMCRSFYGWDWLEENNWNVGESRYFDILINGVLQTTVVTDYLANADGNGKASWYAQVINAINALGDWSIVLQHDVAPDTEDVPRWNLSYMGEGTPELQIQKYSQGQYDSRDSLIFRVLANGTLSIDSDDANTGNPYGTSPDAGECQPPLHGAVQGCLLANMWDSFPQEAIDNENLRQYAIYENDILVWSGQPNHATSYDGANYSTIYTEVLNQINNLANWSIDVVQDQPDGSGGIKIKFRVRYDGPGHEKLEVVLKGSKTTNQAEVFRFSAWWDGSIDFEAEVIDGAGGVLQDLTGGSNYSEHC